MESKRLDFTDAEQKADIFWSRHLQLKVDKYELKAFVSLMHFRSAIIQLPVQRIALLNDFINHLKGRMSAKLSR
jgi:hypothetical protein